MSKLLYKGRQDNSRNSDICVLCHNRRHLKVTEHGFLAYSFHLPATVLLNVLIHLSKVVNVAYICIYIQFDI